MIVALGDRIVMEESLNGALARLVGGEITEKPKAAAPSKEAKAPASDRESLIRKAASALEKAKKAQQGGDWAEYGKQLEALEDAINALQKK